MLYYLSSIYLTQYETLQVPWKMILGNHDYMSNPYAQIEFTTHEKNTMNLWQMPHNYYKFSSKSGMADFFAVDTNGCQGHVQRSHPGTINNLFSQMEWLDRAMKTSSTEWKFVVGHHPMYNKGKGHGSVANCLREKQFSQRVRPRGKNYLPNEYEIVQVKGFGMEDIVSEHSKTVYLSGHEHVFQHHYAKGVQHIICGNSGAEVRGGEYKKILKLCHCVLN
jgi:tartrate-resistant acid phosphatase type 5